MQRLENILFTHLSLPIGTSLFLVAKKPLWQNHSLVWVFFFHSLMMPGLFQRRFRMLTNMANNWQTN
jgi:hypothetical protein